jgi:hypothetical protein
MVVLAASALVTGWGYYRMNPHDPVPAAVLAFGLLGLLLSVGRTKPQD